MLVRISFLAAVAILVACSSASTDIRGPYPNVSESTEAEFLQTNPDATMSTVTAGRTGETTINGETFDVWEAQNSTPGNNLTVWANILSEDQIEIAGGSFATTMGTPLGLPASGSATLDTPIMIDLSPPLGTPQSFSLSGSATIDGIGEVPDGDPVTGTYSLMETDVTVDTPVGTVAGCSHFEVDATVPVFFGETMDVAAELWHSSQLGVVKVTVTNPPSLAGLDLGFSGSNDVVVNGDSISVYGVQVLGMGGDATFALSSYDAFDAVDADKNTHARMLLEVRYADEAMAMTATQPTVTKQFTTGFGYFPSLLVASDTSFFYPEENDFGYTYFIAFVDQAAKNETFNPITYNISASYDGAAAPIRVTGGIAYHRIPAAE